MPHKSGSKIDYIGTTEEDFAKWMTKRFGGDLTANQYAAHDIFKHKTYESLQDEFGGEAADDLIDYLQERAGTKSDNPQPRQKGKDGFYGKPSWATPKPAKQKPAAPTGRISPFARTTNAPPTY